MISSKLFFGVWLAWKNQSLANAAGIRQHPVAVAGFQRESLTGSDKNGRIKSYPPKSLPFGPDPAEIFQIQLDQWQDPAVLAKSGKSRPDSGHFG
jgi:hypothetical protein